MSTDFRPSVVILGSTSGIAQDGKAPAAARVAAARTLLEHAGLVGTAKATDDERRAADDEPEDRMSPSEFLARLAAANRAPA